MEFILQKYNKDNQTLLADGPVTNSKAVLNYSDNKAGLKMRIELNGTKAEVESALIDHFQIVSLGDKTTGEFRFTSRQTKLPIKEPEPEPEPEPGPQVDNEIHGVNPIDD